MRKDFIIKERKKRIITENRKKKKIKILPVKAKANENSYLREKRDFINLFSD